MSESKLLGDRIEDALKRVRADKLAETYTAITGRPCNCRKRRLQLNILHQKMQEMKNRVLIEQRKNAPRK